MGVFIKRIFSILILTLYFFGVIFGLTIQPKITYSNMNTVYGGITLHMSRLCDLDKYEALVIEDNEIEEVGQVEEEIILLDEYEVDLLARAVYNECGILGDEAMYLCGCVILNRIESNHYPNDLYSVLYQNKNGKYQYQIVKNGMINRSANENAYEIARELLTNGSTIPSEVVFQAQFKQGSYVYKQIGNTYFCGL